jgi:hypothetical protein
MTITFRLATAFHDKEIVEVLCDGEVCAAIYPATEENAIKIVSAHMTATTVDDGRNAKPPIPTVAIAFAPESYIIQHGSIIRHRR